MTDATKKLFGLFKRDAVVEEPPKQQEKHDRQRKHQRDRAAKHHPAADKGKKAQSPSSEGRSAESKNENGVRFKEEHVKDKEIRPIEKQPKEKQPKEKHPHEKRVSYKAKSLPPPLTDWPPPNLNKHAELTREKAQEVIASGAPIFRGRKRLIMHASESYYNLYASCGGNGDAGRDSGDVFTAAFDVDSMSIHHTKAAGHPWDTLEQPSMAFYYGLRAGEVTLNHWVSLSRNPNPPIALRDSGVQTRDVDLTTVLNRLKYLERGFEEDYEDLMYKNLYSKLLRDPERSRNPHKKIDNQVADLILVLSRPRWIDFSLPQNQVVAKFFTTAPHADQEMYKRFFLQLLLSMELYHRIHSKHFTDHEMETMLIQLPPQISWTLAVARKWKECMKITSFTADENIKQLKFEMRDKRVQVKALRRFAREMKWPNLVKVDEVLKERDIHAPPLEDRSSDAMSYFTGMILPGATMPWLIMNSLIDCDVDAGVNSLAALTGFQYRSTTYWSATSIVGKVLAPTCRSIAGWIGPARPAPDLNRIQIARIRQRIPRQILSPDDVLSMSERSDPLGPPAPTYPVSEYTLPMPEIDPHNLVDTIRIEKLALKPVSPASTSTLDREKDKSKPQLYDAAVQFAIAGESWPLRLSYDVSFISACPCARGPHPLFFDYTHQVVKIDDILTIRHWGSSKSTPISSTSTVPKSKTEQAEEEEKVLVIEAFGVPDNEVLARAWCAHWALSAVVADMEKTCLACAVRETYAGCLNVVILIERLEDGEDDL